MECCSSVDLSAEHTQDAVRDQKRVLAVAHDIVRDQSLPWRKDVSRDQSLPWRKDVSRREVASVEGGRESQRSRFRGRRDMVLNVSRR